MNKYIKICPACGHKNAESEYVCQVSTCNGYFLGDVEPVLDSEPSVASDNSTHDNDEQHPETEDIVCHKSTHVEQVHTQDRPKTSRFSLQPTLSLEYAGKVYDIESGMVMGKADADSDADLQIPGLPSYVHRRHCQFDVVNNQWHVLAIENPEFSNPTKVNAVKIPPNQSKPIKNGDRLTLCDITFQIRILS